jgi:mannose-6-phosphate isomerase
MKSIQILKNTVQYYKWGSHIDIPKLLGQKVPTEKPWAELWMGAHPKAPSRVKVHDQWISLSELIEKNPEEILGKAVAQKFGNRLPYLFKVLAAAKPLSIQAHPSLTWAKAGFAKENHKGIALNDPQRNYKDENHKPEIICALTPFWALNGFRGISDILSLIEPVWPKDLPTIVDDLRAKQDPEGLKRFFKALMTMSSDRQEQIVVTAIRKASKRSEAESVFDWMLKLHQHFPGDIGVLAPILLNLVCLNPGEAMYLPAGQLHAYLEGTGIELMANSDNVLRGGLTSKHVDVDELIHALNFEKREIDILRPHGDTAGQRIYDSPAEEFVLSQVSVQSGKPYSSPLNRSVEILLCTDGTATITDSKANEKITIAGGTSIIIPAGVENYRIEGNATLYKAAVPS